jgi:hypothetical protein
LQIADAVGPRKAIDRGSSSPTMEDAIKKAARRATAARRSAREINPKTGEIGSRA